jgi:hypothetical protein
MNLLVSLNKRDQETYVVGVSILDVWGNEKESGPYLHSRASGNHLSSAIFEETN